MIEEINEPIDMIAVFNDGATRPLRFRWANRVYHVKRVTGIWRTREGSYEHLNYSLMTRESADCFEISFDGRLFAWTLDRIHIPG